MILVILVMLFTFTLQADLPPDFKKCKRSDNNFNDCLKIAIQDALPKAAKGLPKLKFAAFEPLLIPELIIGAHGVVAVEQRFINVKLYDLSRATIDKVEASVTPSQLTMALNATLADLKWEGDYQFNGKVLALPIRGNGNFTTILANLKFFLSMTGKSITKDGSNYMEITELTVHLNPNGLKISFNNLFDGDERLSSEMMKLINDNWKDLWKDIKGNFEEAFEIVIKNHISPLFMNVPSEQMFPL